MPYLRVQTVPSDFDRPPKQPLGPRPSRYDECVSCRAEPHGMHETKPNSAPIIVCAGTCKVPTTHRFSRSMATTGSAVHLIWACAGCEGERIYGCVG